MSNGGGFYKFIWQSYLNATRRRRQIRGRLLNCVAVQQWALAIGGFIRTHNYKGTHMYAGMTIKMQ